MKRTMLLTCLIVSIGFTVAAPAQNSAIVPVPRPDNWWTARNDAVNKRVAQGHVDLLMIGDSITHGFDGTGLKYWDRYYEPRNAVNMGFGGDRTQHVLWRLEHGHLEGISPKLAVIMIGTNNSNGNDNTAEEIGEGIIAIVKKIREKCPRTKILILAIFPRGANPSPQREKNAKASLIASKMADGKMIFYLDINKKFLGPNGTLSRDIMPDLLHPNDAGYKIWTEATEPMISKLMGEAPGTRGDFKSVFDGKDLTGWAPSGNARWTVTDGCIVGTQGPNNSPGDLFTTKSFGDFEMTCTYKVVWPCNSGIWFRYQSPGKAYQADILEYKNPVAWSGTLYCPGKMFLGINSNPKLVDHEGWNTMRVRAQGKNVKIWLNGHQTVDVNDDTTDSGTIGFQVHPGAEFASMKMIVQEIMVKKL